MSNYKSVAKRLLAGIRDAHTELFALMLAEKAARVRGRYTDAYERLSKAMHEAEEALKAKEKEG
jgi:heme oxygenase